MRARPPLPLLAAALALAPAAVRAQAPDPTAQVRDSEVPGSPVRRAQATADYALPFDRVAARLLDYGGYPAFMRRFRRAQVIRRNRAETDVYFEVALPASLGDFWFLHRMRVERSRDRLLIDGLSREGNAGHVESRIELARTGPDACRITFSLYALPTVPARPATVNQLLRSAVEGGVQQLRRAVEARP
ncbi:MAG: hypothetical protein U0325_35295 [Polyangiales bacterium]